MIRQIRDFWLQFDQTPVKLLSRLKNMGGMWIWEDLPVGTINPMWEAALIFGINQTSTLLSKAYHQRRVGKKKLASHWHNRTKLTIPSDCFKGSCSSQEVASAKWE